ncbi:MAG: hypothetical protein F6K47_36945 [Symploca sp. SIO2E6]|nr:hypothetical protein [Symploca sp. SIO2E6]
MLFVICHWSYQIRLNTYRILPPCNFALFLLPWSLLPSAFLSPRCNDSTGFDIKRYGNISPDCFARSALENIRAAIAILIPMRITDLTITLKLMLMRITDLTITLKLMLMRITDLAITWEISNWKLAIAYS